MEYFLGYSLIPCQRFFDVYSEFAISFQIPGFEASRANKHFTTQAVIITLGNKTKSGYQSGFSYFRGSRSWG